MKEDGSRFYDDGYKFEPSKDEIIREGSQGYIVAYGDMVYRSLDAVEKLRKEGMDVGLINKSTLNVVDESVLKRIGQTKFVLVVESLNQRTGLGSKVCRLAVVQCFLVVLTLQMGTWFLERGLTPRYGYM